MSETNSFSPLLDGFSIGNPISEHNGVRCCPAIRENTDKKYIIKIISIPASQMQMDALLLAGAYRDPSGAMDYFQEKGNDILKEADLLKQLSQLDGFLSYENWQMEPITRHRLGYEICLVGSYKRSVERYIRHHAVTHLEAINLGLDMCSALSVCRQAGALYVDLKPSNIFMSEKKEYRIGDLGFLLLDALRYTTLPDRYISAYTPPELHDPMASINLTADTYALGMILYQLYNDGTLPFKGMAPEEGLPSPVQADYELAEIIMKAVHPDPGQRYQDPAEMGKALAAYMQRNSINDVPITPLRTKKTKTKKSRKPQAVADTQEPVKEPAQEDVPAGTPQIPEETAAPDAVSVTTAEEPSREPAGAEPDAVAGNAEYPEAEAAGSEEPEDGMDTVAQLPAEDGEPIPEIEEEVQEAVTPDQEPESETDEEPYEEPDEEPDDADDPETEEEADTDRESDEDRGSDEADHHPEEEDIALSEDLIRIIAKADDVLSHEIPQELKFPEAPAEEDPFAFALDEEEPDDSDIPYDPLMDAEESSGKPAGQNRNQQKFADPKYKRRRKRFAVMLLGVLMLILLGLFGFWYYENQYLQTIDGLTITGDRSQIVVQVDTQVDEHLLRVTCLDNYGKAETASVSNGQAVFNGLQSNTMYTIRLSMEGFHALTGKTSDVFTTEATTTIISFNSVGGSEDGSVVLSFTVDGDEPDHWAVVYSAEGEQEKRETFTGHSVNITGLSLGKVYTFTLDAGERLSLGGSTSLEVLASRLILAENLHVTSSTGSEMTVGWNSPGDIVVDSWDVRCYNDMGYDQTLTVLEPQAMFTGIDPKWDYTIEVTASGMTQPARTGITANPINLLSFTAEDADAKRLALSWEHSGTAPEGGWLLMYTIDGGENHVVKTEKASAEISPRIPGAKYTFTVQSADGSSVFNNIHAHTSQDAESYEANHLKAEMLTVDLLKTPDGDKWYFENITEDQLTDQFQVGDPISIALRSSDSFYLPGSRTDVLYVIRDAYGNVLSQYSQVQELIWKSIWTGGDSKNGELDLPSVPAAAGSYVLDLYFDGMHVCQLPFTLS